MPRVRSRFPVASRPAKKIDNTVWAYSSGAAGLGAGTAAFAFSSVGTLPTTLLRMRGEVIGLIDAVQTPGKLLAINYGIILVPEGSGTTVQFSPVADANAPWLLYGTGTLGYEEYVIDAIDCPVMSAFRHVIDNKAMRRIRPDVEMQMVFENSTFIAGATANVAYSIRWLQGF